MPDTLTREILESAMKKMLEPQKTCGVDYPHVVHPNALKSPTLTNCANCFSQVWTGTDEEWVQFMSRDDVRRGLELFCMENELI